MSVFSKIASVLLYIVFGISIVVMGFFYFGEQLVNETAYNAKKAKIETPEEPVFGNVKTTVVNQDTTAIDSLTTALEDSTAVDSAAQVIQPSAVTPPASTDAKPVKFSFFEKLVYFRTDIALSWAYILIVITLIVAVVFPIVFMFSNVQNMIKTLGVLVAAAVLIGIAYMLSSGTPIYIPGYEGTDNSNPSVLKFIDTGIFMTYFIIGLALLTILYSEIVNLFK